MFGKRGGVDAPDDGDEQAARRAGGEQGDAEDDERDEHEPRAGGEQDLAAKVVDQVARQHGDDHVQHAHLTRRGEGRGGGVSALLD